MDKFLKCKDVGADCNYTICAKTEGEILEKAKIHAKESHHLDEIPKELYDRARSAIREGS